MLSWCALTPPFCVPNFKAINNPFPLVILTPLRRYKKGENEETKPIFGVHISEMPGAIYLKLECRVLMVASPQQKLSSFVLVAQSYAYAKIVLVFFLSIYSRV